MAERQEKEEKWPDQPKGNFPPNSHLIEETSIKEAVRQGYFQGEFLEETSGCGSF